MAPPPITEDDYMILGVEQTTEHQVIINSYRGLALKLQPDKNPGHDTTEAFEEVCLLFKHNLYLSILFYCLWWLNITARTRLRNPQGRKHSPSLRPHLPIHKARPTSGSACESALPASRFGPSTRDIKRRGTDCRD